MSPFALLSLFRGRASLYGLLGLVLLSTLWVSSLTLLSDRGNATEALTDAGSQILNPFVAKQGIGLTEATYASLQAQAKAHPTQPVTFPLLKVQVQGSEIANLGYADGVRVVYSHVASAYYDGGANAVFEVPDQLKQFVPDFALFTSAASSAGAPGAPGLPDFLQPLFTVVGLTPTTFTAAGHQNLLNLLPWFWLATLVLGGVAVLFNRDGNKLSGLAKSLTHSAWPIVALLGGLWVASLIYATTFAPYVGVLGVVERSFLPVYAAGLVVGLAGQFLPKLLARRAQAQPKEPAMVGVPAAGSRMSASYGSAMPPSPALPAMPSMSSMSGTPSAPAMPSMPPMPDMSSMPEAPSSESSMGFELPSEGSGEQGGDQS